MATSEVDPVHNQSVAFGKDEALHFYMMARSLGSPSDRSISALAKDATRLAVREYGRLDIDVAVAASAVVEAVVSPDFPKGINYITSEG